MVGQLCCGVVQERPSVRVFDDECFGIVFKKKVYDRIDARIVDVSPYGLRAFGKNRMPFLVVLGGREVFEKIFDIGDRCRHGIRRKKKSEYPFFRVCSMDRVGLREG